MIDGQERIYESGNELAAYAAKQINYHIMGYYPITPSTQIAECLDEMKVKGMHDIQLVPAEGEHSAAGICYGASTAGGRVFNATSANGLLYAIEQMPVQSGTRFPMVMNVACRTVSGPLSIKGDHSDIMYALNTGWMIFFANTPQEVYDFNICALKLAEKISLPVIVAFDGFFTSHQKRNAYVFKDDQVVKDFLGEYQAKYSILDFENPVSIGSYMNEPDLINNRYQLHLAMQEGKTEVDDIFKEYEHLSKRSYHVIESYEAADAEVLLLILGSAYHTALVAVDELRKMGKKVGVFTLKMLRPYPKEAIYEVCKNAKTIIIADRQDSYGAEGGNLSLELKALLLEKGKMCKVITRVYGLGGKDFYVEDAKGLFLLSDKENVKVFDYIGIFAGEKNQELPHYVKPVTKEMTQILKPLKNLNDAIAMPKRMVPGHGACPGCGIPVNVNLLLRGIEGNVVLLFQTGCGMIVTTPYPKTAFRIPYIHNLFQNGAATLSGIEKMFRQRQKRGEYPKGDIVFIMVTGDGGMDIGLGSALGTAIRNEHLIIFEYDNGGYMNTGYQLSYSTPKGAKSATSHVGDVQYGKWFNHRETPLIMEATHMPYVATVAESHPMDFINKAMKAKKYALENGTVYIKCLSACPLNWNDLPNLEKGVIEAAVNSCYFPLYEVEQGKTKINYNPEKQNKKIPVFDWFSMMGRTKHLGKKEYQDIVDEIQKEVDDRWEALKKREINMN